MKLLHLTPILLSASVFLSACDKVEDAHKNDITKPETKELVQVPPPAQEIMPDPLTYADQSLSGVFIDYDIKAIVHKADELRVDKKQEFEKTEEFKLRKIEFTSSMNNLRGKPSLSFFVPSTPRVTYNADTEKFNITFITFGNYSGLISYDVSTEFPFALPVAREFVSNDSRYGLKIHDDISYRVGFKVNKKQNGDINLSFPVPIEKAQLLEKDISVAVVGSVVDPVVMHWVSSETGYDKIDQRTDRTLTLSGVQFWVYDKSTLEVIAKFDNNLKLMKLK